MHQVNAFLILHRDEPQQVAEHLERLAALIQAAVAVRGRHQPKAIQLALMLRYSYWMRAGKLVNWQSLLFLLLSTARELKNRVLEAEVYRAWGICLMLRNAQSSADQALENALDVAFEHHSRPDMLLLARLELFNFRAPRMTEQAARTEARAILAEARQLRYRYIEGRVYLSLARMYLARLMYRRAFTVAQQAMVVFVLLEHIDMAGQAVTIMLDSLQARGGGSEVYRRQLLTFFEQYPHCRVNPVLQSDIDRIWATYYYWRGQYALAWRHAWDGCRLARRVNYLPNATRGLHLLGMIHAKRQRWDVAARYLNAAAEQYAQEPNLSLMISVKHAVAYIPFEREQYAESITQLEAVLEEARQVLDAKAFEAVRANIEADIQEARRRLAAKV